MNRQFAIYSDRNMRGRADIQGQKMRAAEVVLPALGRELRASEHKNPGMHEVAKKVYKVRRQPRWNSESKGVMQRRQSR